MATKTHDNFLQDFDPKVVEALEYLESQKRISKVEKSFCITGFKINEPEQKVRSDGEVYETKASMRILTEGGYTIFTNEPEIMAVIQKLNDGAWVLFRGTLDLRAVQKKYNDQTYAGFDLSINWHEAHPFFEPKAKK